MQVVSRMVGLPPAAAAEPVPFPAEVHAAPPGRGAHHPGRSRPGQSLKRSGFVLLPERLLSCCMRVICVCKPCGLSIVAMKEDLHTCRSTCSPTRPRCPPSWPFLSRSAPASVCSCDMQPSALMHRLLCPEAFLWQLQQSQQHLQKYLQPHQAEAPTILAVLVQVSTSRCVYTSFDEHTWRNNRAFSRLCHHSCCCC